MSRVPAGAVRAAGLDKRVTRHGFRHRFAAHPIGAGSDTRTVQELPGHASVETTMRDTHGLNGGGRGVPSPPDGR